MTTDPDWLEPVAGVIEAEYRRHSHRGAYAAARAAHKAFTELGMIVPEGAVMVCRLCKAHPNEWRDCNLLNGCPIRRGAP